MVNKTRFWKLKLESKDLLFVAFQQNKTQNLSKPNMFTYGITIYPQTDQSCWVLVYSVLLVTLFSGITLEDPNTSLTWPSVLPPGWSMEWDPSSTSINSVEWCHAWAYHDINPTMFVYNRVLLFHCRNSPLHLVSEKPL